MSLRISEDLSCDKQLEKCLHSKTQNANESFNGTIWERIPKTNYISIKQLAFGIFDAVANFNIGRRASVLTYEKLSMIPGSYMLKGCSTLNKKIIFRAEYKNYDINKTRRKVLRGRKMEKKGQKS